MTAKNRNKKAIRLAAELVDTEGGGFSCVAISRAYHHVGDQYNTEHPMRTRYLKFLNVGDIGAITGFGSLDNPTLARELALLFFAESL